MALESIKALGQGGAGLDGALGKVLKEMQGLSFAVGTGAGANTTIAIPAIRKEDTVLLALAIADAGGATDHTGTLSIVDTYAKGTITLGTVVNTNAATVGGVAYTFKTAPVAGVDTDLAILGTPTLNAAALAAAINKVENNRPTGARVKATAAAAVVTIQSVVDGTAGNAFTIVGTTNVTASGATLAGGSATGGVQSSVASTAAKMLVVYFNKK